MAPGNSDHPLPRPRSSVINSAAYNNGVRVANVPIPDLGDAWRYSDRFLWVGLFEPDEKLLAHIQEAFGLHGHVRQKSWVKLAKCEVLTWRDE